MDKETRRRQSEEAKQARDQRRLSNIAIAHCWIGKIFFHRGVPTPPKEVKLEQIRRMRRITTDGKR